MSQNLLQWTVADVASYFSAAGFPEQAVAFRTQVSAVPKRATGGAIQLHTKPSQWLFRSWNVWLSGI